jgi:hypothetical protein
VRLPRFSIAEILAIIAFGALDCMAIRVRSHAAILIGGLPMQVVLILVTVYIFRQRRRREKPLPFLIGLMVVGWNSHLIFFFICVQAFVAIDHHLKYIFNPLLNATGFRPYAIPDIAYRCILCMLYLTALQLAAPLIVGWLSQWRMKQIRPELNR